MFRGLAARNASVRPAPPCTWGSGLWVSKGSWVRVALVLWEELWLMHIWLVLPGGSRTAGSPGPSRASRSSSKCPLPGPRVCSEHPQVGEGSPLMPEPRAISEARDITPSGRWWCRRPSQGWGGTESWKKEEPSCRAHRSQVWGPGACPQSPQSRTGHSRVLEVHSGGSVSVPTKRTEISGAALPAEVCPVRAGCSRVLIDADSAAASAFGLVSPPLGA